MSEDDKILANANKQLKHCPFCGGDVEISTRSHGSSNYDYSTHLIVYCKHCKVEMTGGDVSWRSLYQCQTEIDEIIKKWNTRA